MEIKLESDVSEEQVREIMREQHIFLMGVDGKKQTFEVVSMITLDKKVYVVGAKDGNKNALVMFNVVKVGEELRFNVVQDIATLRRVNDKINSIVNSMDKMGIIP